MNNQIRKVVITGASGFLGKNLLRVLNDRQNFYVYALSSHPKKLAFEIETDNIEPCHKDVIFTSRGYEILHESIVINCAYPRNSTGIEISDGLKYIQQVFEESVKNKAASIINISSQSVYSSIRERAASEATCVSLETPYAVGKFAIELLLDSICKNSEINYTNLRMASLIGVGFDQRIVNRLIKTALNENAINVNDSNERFGFLDVNDAVEGIKDLVMSDIHPWNCVYNLGNNRSYTLRDISCTIQESYQKMGLGELVVNYKDSDKYVNSEIDSSSFMETFSYQPQRTLEDSVREIMIDYIMMK